MIENNQAIALWKRCLNFIKDNVNATAYKTWFEPVVPLKYEDKALTIGCSHWHRAHGQPWHT